MKANRTVTIILCGLVALAVLGSFGARGEVAKEKLLERIDSMLGSMDVQRKEIELSVGDLKAALTELRRAKVKAQVKEDQIDRKIMLADSSVSRLDSTLRHLRDELKSESKVTISGRAVTAADLAAMTQQVIRQREVSARQRDGFQAAKDRLSKVVITLERKQAEFESQLTGIENQLAVIDSNRIALKAMQDAATSMNGSEQSFSENITKLEEKVNDLYADVEAGLIVEDVRWADDTARPSVDEIVTAMQSSDDLISQIDSILPSEQLAASQP